MPFYFAKCIINHVDYDIGENMIRLAILDDLNAIDRLAEKTITHMLNKNIKQWGLNYPRRPHFFKDIENNTLYVLEENNNIVGVMALMEENEVVYKTVKWLKKDSMVIHRVFIDPNYQASGYASKLFDYAVSEGKRLNKDSIKIDTHPNNYRMRNFLKKHLFHELDFIKDIHRIAYERVLVHSLNRVIILGSSGTGKTTLAKMLAQKIHAPYLHLDSVYWQKNWESTPKPLFASKIRAYLKKHPRFIMDGNYTNSVTFMERLQIADTLILLDYDKQVAIKGIKKRESQYKHRFRSDMAEGCIEEVDQEFLHYVYRFDKKNIRLKACIKSFIGKKKVFIFKSREDLMRFLAQL